MLLTINILVLVLVCKRSYLRYFEEKECRNPCDKLHLVNVTCHKGCETAVSFERKLSDYFFVKVIFHQESASSLNKNLIVIVMGTLRDNVRNIPLMKLTYADDFALRRESLKGHSKV